MATQPSTIPAGTSSRFMADSKQVPANSGENYTDTPPAEPGEEIVEGAAPEGQELAPQEGETKATEGQPAETQVDQTAAQLEKLLARLNEVSEGKKEAERADAQPESVSYLSQLDQQEEQINERYMPEIEALKQQRQDIWSKIESGDEDSVAGFRKSEELGDQLHQAQLAMREELNGIQRQRELAQRDADMAVREYRNRYAQENPDFVERYQSGEIQQAMQDPTVKSVFGDNPAAVNEHLKARTLSQENEALKAQLAELQKAQQQSVASQTGAKTVGTGSLQNTNRAITKPKTGDTAAAGMFQALQEARARQSQAAA